MRLTRQGQQVGRKLGVLMVLTVLALVASATAAVAGPASTGRWKVEATPATPGSLSDISCTSAAYCVAIGTSGTSGVAETWNGKVWGNAVTLKDAGASRTVLHGVACPETGDCFATGYSEEAGGFDDLLVEHLVDGKWTPDDIGSQRGVSLDNVACSSPTDCMAVGVNFPVGDEFIDHWNGSNWREDYSGFIEIGGVDCPSATSCYAGAATGSNDQHPSVLHWNGSAWSTKRVPGPVGHEAFLAGVSCVNATHCVAVGSSGSGDSGYPLIDVYDGKTWTQSTVQGTAPGDEKPLRGVSCVAVKDCTAVGPTGASGVLVLHWNGTAWRRQATPDVDGVLNAVSCHSTCQAVGKSSGRILAEAN